MNVHADTISLIHVNVEGSEVTSGCIVYCGKCSCMALRSLSDVLPVYKFSIFLWLRSHCLWSCPQLLVRDSIRQLIQRCKLSSLQ